MADAAPCACTTLTVSAQTLVALRARHVGCLCLRCLQELADTTSNDAAGTPRAPSMSPSSPH
jgi:Cysteine-rich CWC